jgi:hypothetical protein
MKNTSPKSVQAKRSEGSKVNTPKIKKCRLCGNTNLVPCIDIGEQYLSSIFPSNLNYRGQLFKYPLDLVLCNKKNKKSCGLLQLGHRFDLSSMYDAYPYTSSTNSAMTKVLEDVAKSGRALRNLEEGDVILDIGGNDGTLLSFFRNDPVRLISIDPAKNIASLIGNVPQYTGVRDFFSRKSYAAVSKQKAKLIFSIAMFYHLDDPLKFSKDVASVLDDNGVWIIQMAYLPAMIKTRMYDNIVHEHAGYYGAQHMKWAMEQIGLEVFDVVENDVYGGSFRIFVKKKGNRRFALTPRYKALLKKELVEGIFKPATYHAFMSEIDKTKQDLLALCAKIKAEGKSIWIYGASTKGNTIMQFCGLGKNEVDAAADSNPFKLGKYIIGSDVIIKSEADMHAAKPDYLLALPYSFVKAFMKREEALVASGTQFISPLPKVKVFGKKR